jgi:hypothetical protein
LRLLETRQEALKAEQILLMRCYSKRMSMDLSLRSLLIHMLKLIISTVVLISLASSLNSISRCSVVLKMFLNTLSAELIIRIHDFLVPESYFSFAPTHNHVPYHSQDLIV